MRELRHFSWKPRGEKGLIMLKKKKKTFKRRERKGKIRKWEEGEAQE